MAAAVTNTGVDRLVAQRISALTEASPKPIAPEFPECDHWFRHAALSRMVGQMTSPVAFAIVRRTKAAVSAFDRATLLLRAFIKHRRTDDYFECLEQFEVAVLQVSFAREMAARLMGRKLFDKGDKTGDDARIYWLYCSIKHNDPDTIPPEHVHAVWLENDCLHAAQVGGGGIDQRSVSFDELRAEIRAFAQITDDVTSGRLAIGAPPAE